MWRELVDKHCGRAVMRPLTDHVERRAGGGACGISRVRDRVGLGAEHEGVQVLLRELGFGGDARDAGATFGGKHEVEDAGALVLKRVAWFAGSETAGGQGSEMGAALALAELSVVVGSAKHGHG